MAHFHHLSICNQNQSISNLVIFWQNTKAMAILFGQKWLIFITFQSAIKITQILQFPQFWPKYLGYSLTFWPNMAHFHHFSICNQNQSISNLVIVLPKYQDYSLTFWPNMAHLSSLFNLQSKSINFKFGHVFAKYQGYSLTLWPKMAQFHHFSICNQYQSISNLVILWQNTKAIALLFGQNWLMLMTFQSAIKITQILKFPQFLANT